MFVLANKRFQLKVQWTRILLWGGTPPEMTWQQENESGGLLRWRVITGTISTRPRSDTSQDFIISLTFLKTGQARFQLS